MSTSAQIGKNEWCAAIQSARDANTEMKAVLRKIMREGGPLIQALVGQAAFLVNDNETALEKLAEIGRQSRVTGPLVAPEEKK